MTGDRLLIYGANGYVGEAAARLAVEQGLEPILAGRHAEAITRLANGLGVEARVVGLDEPAALDRALLEVKVVLHLAGPYLYTSRQMTDACLRAGAHYLDITGELPVLEELAGRDAEASDRGVMLMPAVGLDSVPSDCLAAHLLRRLPSATRLSLGLQSVGPAGLPPGTQRTMIELAGLPGREAGVADAGRAGGSTGAAPLRGGPSTRLIDFGAGPVTAMRFPAPDVFVVSHTTGVRGIRAYVALPLGLRLGYRLLRAMSPLFRSAAVRRVAHRFAMPAPAAAARARTSTNLWAEARDDQGNVAEARLHGPEGGLEWTARAALSVVRRVMAGDAPPGFQTPAGAYGPDLVLEVEGVVREDLR